MKHKVAGNIAKNLKQIRESRGLTQDQCAKLAQVPRPTWSGLESGEGNPTIAVLVKVSTALQVTVDELIGPPKEECRQYKAHELRSHRKGNATVRKILPDPLPGVDFERFELEPAGRMVGVPHRRGTREYLTCEQGTIQLTAAGESWTLKPGDVIVFRGDQNHSYSNPGPDPAVGYSVVLIAPSQQN